MITFKKASPFATSCISADWSVCFCRFSAAGKLVEVSDGSQPATFFCRRCRKVWNRRVVVRWYSHIFTFDMKPGRFRIGRFRIGMFVFYLTGRSHRHFFRRFPYGMLNLFWDDYMKFLASCHAKSNPRCETHIFSNQQPATFDWGNHLGSCYTKGRRFRSTRPYQSMKFGGYMVYLCIFTYI